MNKLIIAIAVLASCAMVSCNDENPDEEYIMMLKPGTGVIQYHQDSILQINE